MFASSLDHMSGGDTWHCLLHYFNLPQNSSSFEKLSITVIIKTAQKIIFCTRISFSSSENQPFSGCTNWRSDSLSTFFLSSHSSFKIKKSHICNVHICSEQRPSGELFGKKLRIGLEHVTCHTEQTVGPSDKMRGKMV